VLREIMNPKPGVIFPRQGGSAQKSRAPGERPLRT
jgi:hypothetical protein